MATNELLNEIREDLKVIKNKMDVLTRLEERVEYHHQTLGRFGNFIDSFSKDMSDIKISLAGNKTSTVDMQSVFKWMFGLIAAFVIATYLNSNSPKAANLPQDNNINNVKKIETVEGGIK